MDRAEHEIHRSGGQVVEQGVHEPGAQRDRHARMPADEAGEHGGQVEATEHTGGPDRDRAAYDVGHLRGLVACGGQLGEDPPGPHQQQLARLGRRHPSGGAREQSDAQLRLEPSHLGGDRRLRHAEVVGGG